MGVMERLSAGEVRVLLGGGKGRERGSQEAFLVLFRPLALNAL